MDVAGTISLGSNYHAKNCEESSLPATEMPHDLEESNVFMIPGVITNYRD